MWRIDAELFFRDDANLVVLPDEFVQQFSFVLYPYVASEFYWSVHEQAVTQLRTGKAQHPVRELIIELASVAEELEQAEQEITSEEYKMLVYDNLPPIQLTPEQGAFLQLFRRNRMLYEEIQTQELQKIEQKLYRLYEWCSV
ncbi:MAG: hypothetical protein V7L05_32135 [Nostoc sp.]|uniref:hypothetical protein n=1 Tax=Nostoc sp. TaxID=1180 RepID=UPI002FFCE31F